MLKAIDLFCGVGGLTYGLEQAGIDVVLGVDADSSCKYAYEKNNNSLFLDIDIRQIDQAKIISIVGKQPIDVIVGCAPCQPFSNHQKNKTARSNHKDWGLLNEFSKIVQTMNPSVVSMENVPQLRKEKIFDAFIADLRALKYYVSFSIVDASDYGVPQRRRRLILLASKYGTLNLIEPTHKLSKVTVKDAIQHLPEIKHGETCSIDNLHTAPILSELNMKRIKASKQGGSWLDWDVSLRCECHKKANGATYSSVYGRMKWNDVSPTITTQFNCYGTGRFGHPEQNRALSLREGALLQSFPVNYEFMEHGTQVPKRTLAKHIGNAVPPTLGRVIGESIIKHIYGVNYE